LVNTAKNVGLIYTCTTWPTGSPPPASRPTPPARM